MFAKVEKTLYNNCKYNHYPIDLKMYLELDKHKNFSEDVVRNALDKSKLSTTIITVRLQDERRVLHRMVRLSRDHRLRFGELDSYKKFFELRKC